MAKKRPPIIYKTLFAKRLHFAFDNAEVSEISQKTGIKWGTVDNYIRGKTQPRVDDVLAMVAASGVDPGWLLTGTGAPQATKPGAPGASTPPPTDQCRRGRLCEVLPDFLTQLGVLLAQTSSSDEAERRTALAQLAQAAQAIRAAAATNGETGTRSA